MTPSLKLKCLEAVDIFYTSVSPHQSINTLFGLHLCRSSNVSTNTNTKLICYLCDEVSKLSACFYMWPNASFTFFKRGNLNMLMLEIMALIQHQINIHHVFYSMDVYVDPPPTLKQEEKLFCLIFY